MEFSLSTFSTCTFSATSNGIGVGRPIVCRCDTSPKPNWLEMAMIVTITTTLNTASSLSPSPPSSIAQSSTITSCVLHNKLTTIPEQASSHELSAIDAASFPRLRPRFVRCRVKPGSAMGARMRVQRVPALACYKVKHLLCFCSHITRGRS